MNTASSPLDVSRYATFSFVTIRSTRPSCCICRSRRARTRVSEELIELVEHAADRTRSGGRRNRRARLGRHRARFLPPPKGGAADLTFLELGVVVRAAGGAQDQIQDVLFHARRLRLRLELGRAPRTFRVARSDEAAAVRADE